MTGIFRYNSSDKRRLYAKKTPRMLMKQNITKIRLKPLEQNIKKIYLLKNKKDQKL